MAAELVLSPAEGRPARIAQWKLYCVFQPVAEALGRMAEAFQVAAPVILAGVRRMLVETRQAQFVLFGMPGQRRRPRRHRRQHLPCLPAVPVLSNRPRHRRRRR